MPEVLRGDPGRVGLPSVLQLLEGEAMSGRLALGPAAWLDLANGLPVAASCEGREGRGAALELFLLDVPWFSFDAHPVEAAAPLDAMLSLIMEGCRLSDEWARLAASTVQRQPDRVEGLAGRLLSQLPDGACLEVARRAAGLARCSLVDPLLSLVEAGALVLGPTVALPEPLPAPPPAPVLAPTPPVAAPPPEPAFADAFVALEEGRRLVRLGDLVGAEAAFLAALTLRPDDRVARQNLARVRQVLGAAPSSSPSSAPHRSHA